MKASEIMNKPIIKEEKEETMEEILIEIRKLLESLPSDTIVSARSVLIEDIEDARRPDSYWSRKDQSNIIGLY